MKICKKCAVKKPLTDFNHHTNTRDKLRPECRDCYSAHAKRHRALTRSDRKSLLRKNYKMTLLDYERMVESQDGRCAICGTDKPGRYGVFCVDHCHSSGAVRGLLCQPCNHGLGNFKDSIARLAKAINYLTASKEEI